MAMIIDSSIRDGGNVNDWNFGKRVITGIIKNLVDAKVDIIELGYLKDVNYSCDRTLYNTIDEACNNIPSDCGNSEFSLMVQEDKWNWNKLTKCDGRVKHIRVSFHKTDICEGLELCKKVIDYGYVCHCNPINIMGYNDMELLNLISKINGVNPTYFTIVDTFGSMKIDDLKRIEALLHNNLNRNINVVAHLHENLGLAFSLAQEFMSYFESKRELLVDASLFGIGRTPGNLHMELVLEYLINEKKADYRIDPIYDAIDDFVAIIKQKHPWGYAMPYALSATYNLHRTYPEYLMGKGKLRTKDIKAILGTILPSEKIIYNEKYIEKMYWDYVDIKVNDSWVKSELKKELSNKNITIVAPGRTILTEKAVINKYLNSNEDIIITVNFDGDYINADYLFYTNPKRYEYVVGEVDSNQIIATSNLLRDDIHAKYIIDYKQCATHDGELCEDSVLMLIRLMYDIGINNVSLIGYDGFEEDGIHFDESFDNQYFDKNTCNKVKSILEIYKRDMNLKFVTRSMYKDD